MKAKEIRRKAFVFYESVQWDMTELNLLLDGMLKTSFFFVLPLIFFIYTALKRSSSFIVYISNSSLGNYCSYVILPLIYVLCSRELLHNG